jgi:hypothetical protein
MIDIYITSWRRLCFLEKTLRLIHERTEKNTFKIHVFDNNSDPEVCGFLISMQQQGKICSLHLDSRNTGCLYNKAVFHAMTESDNPYYIVTDNDVYPPRLSPDWLQQMVSIMDNHEDLAFLTPQLPPTWLQEPIKAENDVVYCKAVGNTFKLVRKAAYPFGKYPQKCGEYGDDGLVSRIVREEGWRVAFCRNIFCFHAGQCKNWGYRAEEVALDPRKQGYGEPFSYEIKDQETYEPLDPKLRH